MNRPEDQGLGKSECEPKYILSTKKNSLAVQNISKQGKVSGAQELNYRPNFETKTGGKEEAGEKDRNPTSLNDTHLSLQSQH